MSFTETHRRGTRIWRLRASRGPSPIRSCSRSAWPTPRAACWARCPRAAAPRRPPSTASRARARKSRSSSPPQRPLATLLLLGPVIALMPQAALAAVVVVYSLELIKPAEFTAIRRVRRIEFRWAVIAFAGVVLLGTLRASSWPSSCRCWRWRTRPTIRPSMSWAASAGQRSSARSRRNTPTMRRGRACCILRTEGRLFFANAERMADRIRALVDEARPRVLALDCRAIFDIEYTALKMLRENERPVMRASPSGLPASIHRSSRS